MAARESFYTKNEARFYKENYNSNKNIKDFKSSYNPLSHMGGTGSNFQPKLRQDQRTSNNIFGEVKQTKADWLNSGTAKRGGHNRNEFSNSFSLKNNGY